MKLLYKLYKLLKIRNLNLEKDLSLKYQIF